jgi:hypothetical protein
MNWSGIYRCIPSRVRIGVGVLTILFAVLTLHVGI